MEFSTLILVCASRPDVQLLLSTSICARDSNLSLLPRLGRLVLVFPPDYEVAFWLLFDAATLLLPYIDLFLAY